MPIFFKTTSSQLASGKWDTGYIKVVPKDGGSITEKIISLEKEFDSKEEADKFSTEYCLQQGYIPAHMK